MRIKGWEEGLERPRTEVVLAEKSQKDLEEKHRGWGWEE